MYFVLLCGSDLFFCHWKRYLLCTIQALVYLMFSSPNKEHLGDKTLCIKVYKVVSKIILFIQCSYLWSIAAYFVCVCCINVLFSTFQSQVIYNKYMFNDEQKMGQLKLSVKSIVYFNYFATIDKMMVVFVFNLWKDYCVILCFVFSKMVRYLLCYVF